MVSSAYHLLSVYLLLVVVILSSAPQGAFADVEQVTCSDTKCSESCSVRLFPENTCELARGGGSVVLYCGEGVVYAHMYVSNTNCQGSYVKQTVPQGECLATPTGSSAAMNCVSSGPSRVKTTLKGVFVETFKK